MTPMDWMVNAPKWWREWLALTPEQIDAMADEYQREQIASAQSEAAFEANKQEANK